jgi:hypothetical protein
MTESESTPLRCPRCGSMNVTLCGQSTEFGPEQRQGQPLAERERKTLAYHCECGLGFTQTLRRPETAGQGEGEGAG